MTRVGRSATAASLVACAAGGLALALALTTASPAGAQDGATEPPPATTAPPAAPPPAPTAPRPRPPRDTRPTVIAPGITIGKVLVGGLTRAEATELVRSRFRRPLRIVLPSGATLRVSPTELGATTLLGAAVRRAFAYRSPLNVPLPVRLSEPRVRRFVDDLASRVDREPADARLVLRKLRPFAIPERVGRKVKRPLLERRIANALRAHLRDPIELPVRELRPEVTRDALGQAIVIRRGSKLLQLFDGTKLRRTFRVATGQSSYPTPLGSFEIVTMWRNPWWYPPAGSDWAEGAEPIPPGPGNPLGTRWMGISAPYIGIHGTPDAASIGYSASHGCVRMLVPQAEWLFEQVSVGTPVFIVAA